MSFPRYPSYKDSGVAWLGPIPVHWQVQPLKAVASCNDDVLAEDTKPEYEIKYIEISDVAEGLGILRTQPMRFCDAPSRARRVVVDGDVLISTVRTYLRAIATIQNPPPNIVASTGFAAIRPRDVLPKFLGYMLHCEFFICEVISQSVGVSYPAINSTEIMRIKGPIPPAAEQEAIAVFLDREITKIDVLIAEQERLIELLRETRQGVISHAATKGANSDVPMKPSGAEWLGDVPAHWESKRLSEICHFEPGKAHEPYIDESGEFVCVNSRFVSTEGDIRKFCTVNLTPARRGDILMVMSDLPNGRALAKAFLVRDEGPYAVNQRVCILRANRDCPEYLFFLLNRHPYLLSFDDGVNQTHLPNSAFKQLRVFMPPHAEQVAIASELERVTSRYDELMETAEAMIRLMRERRSALISAAVTGQIDVRGLVEQEAA